jgi:hypothetical protein
MAKQSAKSTRFTRQSTQSKVQPVSTEARRKTIARIRLFLIMLLPVFILAFPFSLTNAHLISGSISYQTTWETGSIVRDTATKGWSVVNDLGYTVHVERGYIVTTSTTLNECDHTTGVVDWMSSLFSTSVAHAGHTSGGPDQAAILASHVESLTTLQPLQLGSVNVNEYSYCKGHYLVAQASSITRDLPQDVPMEGHSLYVEGTYQAPGSTDSVPFVIKTSVGDGALFNLKVLNVSDAMPSVHAVIGQVPVQITIRRHIDGLFSGVDFMKMDDDTRAQTVLDALIAHTEMIVTGGKWH